MAVMAAFLVTMFTLSMMAGNKVEINGVSKQVYGHDVNEVSGYDNAFSTANLSSLTYLTTQGHWPSTID